MVSQKSLADSVLRPFPGFQFYFYSLIVLILLNIISPSDGRGDSLFKIGYMKLVHKPRIINPTGAWTYSVNNIEYTYHYNRVTFTSNQTENIVAKCIVVDYNSFENQEKLLENTKDVFFLHAHKQESLSIDKRVVLDNEYQIICKYYAVTRKTNEEKLYRSNLFTLTDSSVSFSQPRFDSNTNEMSFLVYNNPLRSLFIIPDTTDISPRHNYLYHTIYCKFIPETETITYDDLVYTKDTSVLTYSNVLPMSPRFIRSVNTDNKLWCVLRRKDESHDIYTDIVKEPHLVNP